MALAAAALLERLAASDSTGAQLLSLLTTLVQSPTPNIVKFGMFSPVVVVVHQVGMEGAVPMDRGD